jgi:lipoprotein-anchoring transpeptidase ErfK/SrfK
MRFQSLFAGLALACLSFFAVPVAAQAAVVAKISISSQTMNVYVDGSLAHSWKVSTAGKGYVTPRGNYRAGHMARMHYSKKYFNSPMPYSIFFRGGYAIHGTGALRQLGRPASHGCVRLHPSNAARLYSLVQQHGRGKTSIVITN